MQAKYTALRAEFEARFATAKPIPAPSKRDKSPSGKFVLDTSTFQGESGWGYSRGEVRANDGRLVADIKRNHGVFWHTWVVHADGNEYLLCGEDYQGYTVIECQSGRSCVHFPEEAFEGMGFCWAAVQPSPDGRTLAVEGCYWAHPYELVFVDFTEPFKIPLPELQRFSYLDQTQGWAENLEYRFTVFEDEEENPPAKALTWKRDSRNAP